MEEGHKVPISSIKGTCPNGRIVNADIEDYLATASKATPLSIALTKTLEYMDIPLSQIRKVTASRLLLSKQTIPHYYLTVNTCVEKLMELEIIVEINKRFLEMIFSYQPNMENRLNNMCIIDDSIPISMLGAWQICVWYPHIGLMEWLYCIAIF